MGLGWGGSGLASGPSWGPPLSVRPRRFPHPDSPAVLRSPCTAERMDSPSSCSPLRRSLGSPPRVRPSTSSRNYKTACCCLRKMEKLRIILYEFLCAECHKVTQPVAVTWWKGFPGWDTLLVAALWKEEHGACAVQGWGERVMLCVQLTSAVAFCPGGSQRGGQGGPSLLNPFFFKSLFLKSIYF